MDFNSQFTSFLDWLETELKNLQQNEEAKEEK